MTKFPFFLDMEINLQRNDNLDGSNRKANVAV